MQVIIRLDGIVFDIWAWANTPSNARKKSVHLFSQSQLCAPSLMYYPSVMLGVFQKFAGPQSLISFVNTLQSASSIKASNFLAIRRIPQMFYPQSENIN